MNIEEKKIEDKSGDSGDQERHENETDRIEKNPPRNENNKFDEKDEIKQCGEIKKPAENVEVEKVEMESTEKVEKEEGEKELTKDEIKEIIKKSLERDEFLDKLQRTRAEYLNFQKRKNKEIEEIRRFAIQDMVIALTSVLNNFSRAIQSVKESNDFNKLLEGIRLVEDQFYKTLEGYGVKPIETVGKPFDPMMHEAVIEEEDNNHPHHTVIMELQKGFLLHDRVIRPAKVKVSKREEKEGEDSKQVNKNEEVKDNKD